MRFADPRSPLVKAWSGSAARADAMRYAGGDLSTSAAQSKYKSFFLVCDGDPASEGSYKFPYKRLVNGKPAVDAEGLAAAKATAHGARSGQTNPAASAAAGKVKKNKKNKKNKKDDSLDYAVTKSFDEERYTFGPLYTPDEIDAHNEFTRASELQKAMWNFVRKGARTVHKQHDQTKPIGEVVDAVVWPYEQEVQLSLPGREVRKATLPAGTAYVGVVWSPEAWPAVKGGAITGFSMGGKALRIQSGEVLPPMRKSA